MAEHDGSGDGAAKKNVGKRKVAAVIGGVVDRLDHRLKVRTIRWPARGMPYLGIYPGAWREDGALDETGFLPEDCPVRPLGYNGEDYYFVDTSGQVFCTGDKALGVERIQKLFAGNEDFLTWAWPAWSAGKNRRVTGFKAEEVRRDLYAACRERGPWTPTDRVRGRGAWLENGRLVLHCGEHLWIDGRLEETGEHGEHFYVRRPAALTPWPQPVDLDTNPAIEIFKALDTWRMKRGRVDVMLVLGEIGVSMMGAALDWRPSIFVVGDYGTGKSELVGKTGLVRSVLGRSMLSTTNATEAGLYQIVGHDSLPVAIDELEGDDNADQAKKIIKMARDAASGSVRIRGGQDHKGVEFEAQSVFWFSAINPPGLPPASLSRLAVIQLDQFPPGANNKAPKLKAPETVGPRLLRRIADNFSGFQKLFDAYAEVLRACGHNSRGQKTFGTFLAAAHLLLGDEGMEALGLPFESLDYWGEQLAADVVPELENVKPSWLDCLMSLMTRPIEGKFSGGQRLTAATIVDDAIRGERTIQAAQNDLAAADLGLVVPDDKSGMMLAIPNQSDVLAKHMLGTAFSQPGAASGSWSWALRRAPEDICIADKAMNRVIIAGMRRRCTLIRMRAMREWMEANA